MKIYQAKSKKIAGTEFKEVRKKAFELYQQIKRRSKRRTYIRSAYFKKDKIFLDLFWEHLFDKQGWRDRVRRLKYFPAAIELIRTSKLEPRSKENPNKKNEILHRFAGATAEKDLFFVQIKEDGGGLSEVFYFSLPGRIKKDSPLSVVYKLRPKVFVFLLYLHFDSKSIEMSHEEANLNY